MTQWRARTRRTAVLGWFAIAVAAFAIGLVATPAVADQHEPENAPTFNNTNPKVTYEITLPHTTDHYPGDHAVHGESNGYNASIEYAAAGEEAFDDFDAEDGIWIDYIEVGADWIDYSECDATRNTRVFGIDRGNDNQGTNADEDLVEHRKGSDLGAGGLTITFFDWSDLSGDPPYLGPPDAIVAAQGAGSNDGPCLKMTSEPGWYQVQAYANGTIANECTEEGNGQCEPDDKQWRGVNLRSNYVYICECDSEEEAREKLGPPPNEQRSGASNDGGDEVADATPTPSREPAVTSTPTPAAGTATTTRARTATATATPGADSEAGRADGQRTDRGDDQREGQRNAAGNQGSADRGTPTIASGAGFTPIAAVVALFAAALRGVRRD